MKLIKFDLRIDGAKISTIEQLQNHFTAEILDYLRSGLLAKWLEAREFSEELEKIKGVTSTNNFVAFKSLCAVFRISADDEVIKVILGPVQETKFDLPIDGTTVSTLEQLQDHFTADILLHLRSGLLAKWLQAQGFSKELQKIDGAASADDFVAFKTLCAVFSIDADEEVIKAILGTVEENQEANEQDVSVVANNESAETQFQTGMRYYEGEGVANNDSLAAAHFRKAAEQGHAEAQYEFGHMLLIGRGVPENEVEAMKWFRKAAEQEHAWAEDFLGDCYNNGWGCAVDEVVSVRWYRKAAEHGLAQAQFDLGCMYLSGKGVPKNGAEAVKWLVKAAKQGHSDAQYNMGVMCASGDGIQESDEEAVEWYRKAAAQGSAEAQANLGAMYQYGTGVPESNTKALSWYRKAAEQGLARAQCNLGLMHLSGAGIPANGAEALKWFCKAAEQGDVSAHRLLGIIYLNGDGLPENIDEAVKWFSKVEKQEFAEALEWNQEDIEVGGQEDSPTLPFPCGEDNASYIPSYSRECVVSFLFAYALKKSGCTSLEEFLNIDIESAESQLEEIKGGEWFSRLDKLFSAYILFDVLSELANKASDVFDGEEADIELVKFAIHCLHISIQFSSLRTRLFLAEAMANL